MGTESYSESIARSNVRRNQDTSPPVVRALLDEIDRLNRVIEMLEED